ncbi:MAG: PAS domain-containing protein, partial [Syntrophales bacterium]
MNIDITTLAMAIGIINILQVGALFSQWQFDKNHFPGQGWWLLGTGSMALGFVAMFLRAIPPLASICVFGNYVFFVCALTFQYIGILRFFGQRERRGPIIAFLAICILVAIYLTFINNDIVLRRIALYLTVAALGFLTTRAIFRHKTRFVNTSANLLAAVFLTQGIALTAATLLLITGPPPATSTATSTEQIVAMLNALITTSLWTIGFIFMVNQRLGAANSEATENRELIFNTAPDAILVTRLNDGIVVEINDGFTMLTGYTRAEVIGKSTTAVNIWKNPEDRKLVLTALHEKGYFENLEAVFQCKDGSQLAGLMSARIINLQGEPHIVSVTRNITGRKLAEANLRISEERYRLLAENANDVIWTMSLDGRITYVSPSVERMRGFTPGEAMNQPLDEILTPDSAASSLRYWKELAARLQAGLPPQRFHGEYEYYCKDGSTVWTDVQVIPYVVGVNSQPAEILGVTRDIGERKQAEEYREMRQEILAILNEPEDSPDAMQRVLAVLKARTRCSAVAIRLQEGADFPYFAQDGFPADFLRTENTLISRDADGLMCRDKDGNVRLECTCGLVMEGRTDPANSLFTRGGSFWTSDSFPLLDLPSDQDPRHHPRNQCMHHGYASFALVP